MYCFSFFRLYEVEKGFVIVMDKRNDGWGTVKSILLKLSVSIHIQYQQNSISNSWNFYFIYSSPAKMQCKCLFEPSSLILILYKKNKKKKHPNEQICSVIFKIFVIISFGVPVQEKINIDIKDGYQLTSEK